MFWEDKKIDGKEIANRISEKLKHDFNKLNKEIKFCIFQVGNNPASNKYVKYKLEKASELGINAKSIKFDSSITQDELIDQINTHINNYDVAIVQLPLPEHIDRQTVLDQIPFNKDADGLASNNTQVTPATPRGIITLLEELNVDFTKVHISVVGKSKLVGEPTARLCKEKGAKVSSYDITTGINGTENSEVLIVAAGHTGLIKANNIKEDAIVIDVGINEIADKNAMTKIIGDVDRTAEVINKVKKLTPVPGGVGPMTVISLFQNIYDIVK